jgi:hypothetical protein
MLAWLLKATKKQAKFIYSLAACNYHEKADEKKKCHC